jgi:hypothetical protein
MGRRAICVITRIRFRTEGALRFRRRFNLSAFGEWRKEGGYGSCA